MSRRPLSGNKAVFFSLMAILLLAVIALQFAGRQKIVIESESETLDTRFAIANNLVNDVEFNILPRLLEADVGRALDAIAFHVNDTGYLATIEALRVLVNESVMNSTSRPGIRAFVGNATLPAQLPVLAAFVREQLRSDLAVRMTNVSVWQDNVTGYMQVGASADATIELRTGFANWSRRRRISTLVDVEGLHDPLALRNGLVPPTVRFNEGNFSLATLPGVIMNRTYTYDMRAPSYLQRFTGEGESDQGIESLVGLNANARPGTDLLRASFVDWCYWSGRCNQIGQAWTFWTLEPVPPGMTSRTSGQPFYAFMLDSYHLKKYDLLAFQTTSNECSCNRALDPPRFQGAGCVGAAADEGCS